MVNVVVSRLARNDLIGIRDYIRDELQNPDAAVRIISALREQIESLSEMPDRGKPLDAILEVHTGYRYLVWENYRVFYLTTDGQVEIIRVLHVLQDYMRALFL